MLRSDPIPARLDRGGTEYCRAREHHEYELYLALLDLRNLSIIVRVRTSYT